MMEDRGSAGDGLEQFESLPPVPRARLAPMHVAVVVSVAGLAMVALLVNDGFLVVPPQFGTTLEGSPFSYSEALRSIQSLVNQEPGGPWKVSSALGLGTAVGISGPAPSPVSTRSCIEKPVFTGNIEYPATPEWAPPGYVSSWSIEWAGALGGDLAAVVWNTSVLSGELVAIGSGNCSNGAGLKGAFRSRLSTRRTRLVRQIVPVGALGCFPTRAMRPFSS